MVKALQMVEDVSCIRFRAQREVQHYDHLEFLSGRGCYTQIGRSGNGKQEIFLRPECAQVGTHLILHEARHGLNRNYRPVECPRDFCYSAKDREIFVKSRKIFGKDLSAF